MEKTEIVTKENLLKVFNREHTRYDIGIDVHISSIRKNTSHFGEKEIIKTVRGSGYIFIDQLDE